MPCARRGRLFAAVASLPSLLIAAPAVAELGVVDELVVTAQQREQAQKDVPFALAAYSGGDLDDLRVQNFADLGRFTPGFDVQNQSPNKPGFVMRGITSDSGEATNEARVSVFQDGVSISRSRGAYVELFDIERVEVVKGPQSTLYGRGALIGGVNLIQNKADPRAFGLSAQAEAGDNGYWLAEGAVNAPLGETAAIRLAGRIKQRDGYVDNLAGGEDFNSVDTRAIRAALSWAPSADLRVDVIGNYQKDTPSGVSFKSGSYRPTDPVTGAVLGTTAPWDGAYLTGASGIEGGKALGLDRDVWGVTSLVQYEINPAVTLNSISAYRRFEALEVLDADGLSLAALTASEDARGSQWSQELRLNFTPQGSISGFVGAAYFREKGTQRGVAQFDERIILSRLSGLVNGGPLQSGRLPSDAAPGAVFGQNAFTAALLQGVAAGSGVVLSPAQAAGIARNLKASHVETATNGGETEAVDVFGDVTFRATERLELSLGARYSHDDKTSTSASSVLNGRSILGGFFGALSAAAPARTALLNALAVQGAATIPLSPGFPVPLFGLAAQPTVNNGDVAEAKLQSGGLSWRATARYALSDAVNLYANYGRGRRPRVLSALPAATPFTTPNFSALPAEIVDSFEVGAKGRSADRRLAVEASVFHYRYKNFQTLEQFGTTFVLTNAGAAKATGFEGQARFAASDALDLFATYAYNHSRFETGLREGNRFRLSPDHSLAVGAAFRAPMFGGELSLRPTWAWQSKVFFDDDNDRSDLQRTPPALVADTLRDEVQKAYGLANLRIDFRPGEGPWSVGAFVTNLFGKRYIKDAGNIGDTIGLPTFIAGEPRFVGMSVAYRR